MSDLDLIYMVTGRYLEFLFFDEKSQNVTTKNKQSLSKGKNLNKSGRNKVNEKESNDYKKQKK